MKRYFTTYYMTVNLYSFLFSVWLLSERSHVYEEGVRLV
jgi:hypothetical protein